MADQAPIDKPSGAGAANTAVPSGRWTRMARMGSLATGLAGGMLAEGARQWTQGRRPSARDLLLTPANARRVADQLAQLRGAAMKVGQLLSMDAGEWLPPELSDMLARLRSDARPMPIGQMDAVLSAAWGPQWEQRFAQFSFTPLAAASIGQVHRARTREGVELAIKVQYPGIRESIDSDVDNVGLLLRVSGLLPRQLDIAPLLAEAKRQLHEEAHYLREADCLEQFARLLAHAPDFVVPAVHRAATTDNILTMDFIDSVPIESLELAPQAERDRVARLLWQLMFRELFEFQQVQTDPNFANFRYERGTGRIVLLDFGATRAYPASVVQGYRQLMQAALQGDRQRMSDAAQAIGYFSTHIRTSQREAVLQLFTLACEPLLHAGDFDFGASDLASRVRAAGLALSADKDLWHTPPADALFLHRKIAGLYLLAARLRARVPIQALAQDHLAPDQTTT